MGKLCVQKLFNCAIARFFMIPPTLVGIWHEEEYGTLAKKQSVKRSYQLHATNFILTFRSSSYTCHNGPTSNNFITGLNATWPHHPNKFNSILIWRVPRKVKKCPLPFVQHPKIYSAAETRNDSISETSMQHIETIRCPIHIFPGSYDRSLT